jgi:5-methylcytosine-specific restriction endonuclease McrA
VAEALTLDHVTPRHRGGLTVHRNLVAACERCNRRKGSEDWREWFSRQEHHCPEREERIQRWLTG